MTHLKNLQEKYRQAVLQRNYAKLPELQQAIRAEMQRIERTSLGSLLPSMTKEDRIQSLRLMHRLFVFADILYGIALEFEGHMRNFDPSISVDVCCQAKKAASLCRDIIRNVDAFEDEKMSEGFGEMCDTIQMMVMNEIYKRETRFDETGK